MVDNYLTLGVFMSLTEDYVIGNHDIELEPLTALKQVVRSEMLNGFNMKFHYPSLTMEVDGAKWLVTHGHLYGKFGKMFRFLDSEFVKGSPVLKKIGRWMVKSSLLHRVSTSRSYNNSIRNDLVKEAKQIGAKVVVFGHTHQQQLINQDGIIVLNAGDGMRGEYAVYNNGEFLLKTVA
jgi:predicted phosphodiesterase